MKRLAHKNSHSHSNTFQAIALFGLIFFGFYFVFSSIKFESYDEDRVDILALDQKVDKAVNKSLRSAYNKKQLRDLEVSTERLNLTQKFKEKFNEKSRSWVPEQQDSTGLYKEDMSSNEVNLSSISVEAQLRGQVSERKEIEEEQRQQRLEYIKAYKENAKRDGWAVELNDKLEVISAKPIKF